MNPMLSKISAERPVSEVDSISEIAGYEHSIKTMLIILAGFKNSKSITTLMYLM
jgi:hypothetical protein